MIQVGSCRTCSAPVMMSAESFGVKDPRVRYSCRCGPGPAKPGTLRARSMSKRFPPVSERVVEVEITSVERGLPSRA